MDGVSGASAVASLVILGAKVAKQTHAYFGTVKNASDDIRHISSDLQSVVEVLGAFETALKDASKQNVFNAMNGRGIFVNIINELMDVYKRYELLMKNFDKAEASLKKRSKWGLTGETEAQAFRRTLNTHKQTLILTMSLTNTLSVSSIGNDIQARLKQTEENTELILLQLRNEIRLRQAEEDTERILLQMRQVTVDPSKDAAVQQWLMEVSSFAQSTMGDEDATDRLRDFASETGTEYKGTFTPTTFRRQTFRYEPHRFGERNDGSKEMPALETSLAQGVWSAFEMLVDCPGAWNETPAASPSQTTSGVMTPRPLEVSSNDVEIKDLSRPVTGPMTPDCAEAILSLTPANLNRSRPKDATESDGHGDSKKPKEDNAASSSDSEAGSDSGYHEALEHLPPQSEHLPSEPENLASYPGGDEKGWELVIPSTTPHKDESTYGDGVGSTTTSTIVGESNGPSARLPNTPLMSEEKLEKGEGMILPAESTLSDAEPNSSTVVGESNNSVAELESTSFISHEQVEEEPDVILPSERTTNGTNASSATLLGWGEFAAAVKSSENFSETSSETTSSKWPSPHFDRPQQPVMLQPPMPPHVISLRPNSATGSKIRILGFAYDLGNMYREQGRLKEAEQLLIRVLAEFEGIYGSSAVETYNALKALLHARLLRGKVEESEYMLRRALDFDQRFGVFDAGIHQALGMICMKRGNLTGAESFLKRAVADALKTEEVVDENTMAVIYNLAEVYFMQGRHQDAAELYARSIGD